MSFENQKQEFKEELKDSMIELAEKYLLPADIAGQIAIGIARTLRKDLLEGRAIKKRQS